MRSAVHVVNNMLTPRNPNASEVVQPAYEVVASPRPDSPNPVQLAM